MCGVQQIPVETRVVVNDSGSIGWAFLGFFIPLVGFILWLAWMDTKPKCSRMSGLGVLSFVVLCVALVGFLYLLAFLPE